MTPWELDREIATTRDLVQEAWDERQWTTWHLLSAWLLGSRVKRWLMHKGWLSG
jgi:hypothetical protein